jgi:hypothetical protein
MNSLSVSDIPVASPVETVTVSARLLHKQRGVLYLLLGFVVSGLLLVGIIWLAGSSQGVLLLAVMQFFLLPFAAVSIWKSLYVEPVLLSFTSQGLSLKASDQHYQEAWANLAGYKVEMTLDQLVGAGYRLTLQDIQGHSEVFNILEQALVDSDGEFRADSALSHLCRYIGWYNKSMAGKAEQIVLLPTIFDRKIGKWLLGIIGVLFLFDIGIRGLHFPKASETLGTLAAVFVLCLHTWGQKRNNDRYTSYIHRLEGNDLGSCSIVNQNGKQR